MRHRGWVAKCALLAMLNNALEGSIRGADLVVPDGIVRHVNPINEEAQAEKIVRAIKPSGVKQPQRKGVLRRITEAKSVLGNSSDNRTSTIVLEGILGSTSAHEKTNIGCFMPLLEASVGTPPVPQRGKHSGVHSWGGNFAQGNQVASDERAIVARQTKETIRHIPPSIDFASNSLNSIRKFSFFDGSQGRFLKLPKYLTDLIFIPRGLFACNGHTNRGGGYAFALEEISIVN